jgi:hypothetical protein
MVSLRATPTDTCDSTVVITNNRTVNGADASDFYPLGATDVIFTATDASGDQSTCTSRVQVSDTTPPSLTVALTPTTLWPPNHRMVAVWTAWEVTDICDPRPGVVLTATASSEPDDEIGSGDGNTTGDIQDASIGTPDTLVLLRAERLGDGPGRIYTLTYAASDASNNKATALGLATVPHDLGTGPEPLQMLLESDDSSGMADVHWNTVPGAQAYDLIQGDLDQIAVRSGIVSLGPVRVLASGITETRYSEGNSGGIPSIGEAFFYLVQYRDGNAASGWGTESSSWPARPLSCDTDCPGETIADSIATGDRRRR